MALSVPTTSVFIEDIGMTVRDLMIIMTYSVVVFLHLVQGTTIENMIKLSKRHCSSLRSHTGIGGTKP